MPLPTIYYYIKSVYGEKKNYLSSKNGHSINYAIRNLTDRKTLTAVDMSALSRLGFELVEVFESQEKEVI